jgi:iron complex outermembrane recepter protein
MTEPFRQQRERRPSTFTPVSPSAAPLLACVAVSAASIFMGGVAGAQTPELTSVEEIIVTGSRIRRETSLTETSAPLTVIDRDNLIDRGFVQVGQALNQNTSTVPSQPISPFNGSSSGGGEQVPALFGLGAGRTLTLVNGRRFVSTASGFGVPGLQGSTNDNVVDTNIIPTGLLSRIEIVQGGGAAVYGSDAMGGVINYVLRDDFEGLEVDAQYGESSRGDYQTPSARITWGTNFGDRGNVAVNVEWSDTDPLFARDRPASALGRGRTTAANPADTGPNDGIPSVAPVFDTAFWEFSETGLLFYIPNPACQSNPPSPGQPGFPIRCFVTTDGVRYNQLAGVGTPAQFSADGSTLVPFDPGVFPGPGPSIPFASGGDGYRFNELGALYSGVERASANLLGHYELTDKIRLSTELLYSKVEGEDPRAVLISNTILNAADTGSGAISIAAANPFLSAGARSTIVNFLNANPPLFGPNSGNAWAAGAPLPISMSKTFTDILPSNTGTRELNTWRALFALDGEFAVGSRDMYWSVSASLAETDGEVRTWGIWQSRFANAINARPNGSGGAACGINVDANPANDDPACAPINPFGVGNVSPAARDYVSARFGQDFDNEQRDYLATLGGTAFALPGGEVKFSVAYEHRDEEATFTPTEASRLGVGRLGIPTAAQSGEYDTDEFSAEVVVPLLGEDFTVPMVETLELSGAYRTVDNSIAGTENVWGAGVRWSVVADVTFRGSRSRNFRAPNLAQLFAPTTSGLEAILQDPCDAQRIALGPNPAVRRANCEALFAANPSYGPLATFEDPAENFPTVQVIRGGNPDLENETSDTWTYGVVLQPRFVPGLTVLVDRIEVDLEDGLSFFTPQDFLATCFDSSPQPADICAITARNELGHVISSSALTFNAGSIRFRGETYTINYSSREGGWGRMDLTVEATHTSLLETSVTGVDLNRTDDTATNPDWRARFDARYSRGPLGLLYTLDYLPETRVTRQATIENNPNPVLDANYRHSISARYEIGEMFTVRAGVENLTDEEPSFPSLTYGDLLGRRYFLGLTARF